MPKVFVSHSHLDSEMVMLIKTQLERHGISVFVAHRDIVPSLEWRDEILRELDACEVLVALLTDDYKKSAWTDQECGIAIAKHKIVLPVAIDLMPYGFMEKFQALIWKRVEFRKGLLELTKIVTNRIGVPTDDAVKAFESSPSYDDAGFGIQLVLGRNDLTREQINRVARASVNNDQIYNAGSAQDGLAEFFKKYAKEIDQETRTKRQSIISGQSA